MINCPHCKTDLKQVYLYKECIQKADIDENGVIVHYWAVSDITDDVVSIACPNCGESVQNLIKE
jgi:endogenous inhibitor of DNA gyrase (YacG/DUF329 family)